MSNRKSPQRRGFGSRLRQILGTSHLKDLVTHLRHQNQTIDKLRQDVERLSSLVAAQNKAIAKNADLSRSYQAKILDVQKEVARVSTKTLRVNAAERSRLDQISYSLFELNRTVYSMYRGEDFDLGSAAGGYFSQNGEDGVVGEIARRLGIEIETFVEIGAGDGSENNSIHLLLGGARGLWVEADQGCVAKIEERFAEHIAEGQLKVVQSLVDAENVNDTLRESEMPDEVDFLSLDIDGNDYWVWNALTAISPKILCLEYNAFYGPHISWTKSYEADFKWPGKNIYYGASLKALEKLSRSKGFTLVACDYSGVNAFFVRDDLINETFTGPFVAEHLFQPFRGLIGRRPPGKELVLGPYENV